MGRLLQIWRSWSVARRLALVGGLVVVVTGAAVAAYLVTKRPADVSNPDAPFQKQKHQKKKPETLDWPMYGYDHARNRYLPVKGLNPPFGSPLWTFQAGKLLEFQPIVVHGTIYFMDKDATFYALSVHGGP
jgi:glucose dehydrogenase